MAMMAAPTAAFLVAMATWVAQLTGLPPALPQVVIATAAPDGSRSIALAAPGAPGVNSLTLSDGTIYLPPSWVQGSPDADCLVAHEIVHVLQFRAGRRYRCVAERERLAYAVEEICMAQRGVDFWAATGWTPMVLARQMECR